MSPVHPSEFPRNALVAFQGAKGAYSELAIRTCLAGFEPEPLPCREFEDAFRAVRDGRAAFAMLPVENALTGSILDNFDLFLQYNDMEIVAEHRLRIQHNLIAKPEASLEDIVEVYSHPQGLLQCANFLDRYPLWKRTVYYDTAGSVEMVAAHGDKSRAAIASALAAETYGMKIIAPGIETNARNYTRFALIRKIGGDQSWLRWPKHDKASVVFGLADRPGSLLEALAVFAGHGLNLKKIESRPIHGKPFEYMFYVDLEMPTGAKDLSIALASLAPCTSSLRLLGEYPLSSDR